VRLLSILDAAGFNGFSSMVWFQGHYESRNGNTAPLYLAQLQEFFTVLRARYGQFQAAMCSIGAIGSYVGSVANINMVRATMLAYVASDPLSAYFDALDPNPDPDLVHASQAGNVRIAIHIYRAICKQLGIRSAGARGPVLNGTATRPYNSATITLPVTQTAGGTAWVETGDCIDQFVVYNDAAPTTPVTISDINVSNPAQLGIVLASAPTEPASLKVWYRPRRIPRASSRTACATTSPTATASPSADSWASTARLSCARCRWWCSPSPASPTATRVHR
jgi:hypothetical protein